MNADDELVSLWSDGGCAYSEKAVKGRPLKGVFGGWCTIMRWRTHEIIRVGAAPSTTNNRMELTAVLEGLLLLERPSNVQITTDSLYVMEGCTVHQTWWRTFKLTRGGKQVQNLDLWERLWGLLPGHVIHWRHVRGHSGERDNERCDKLAGNAARSLRDGKAFSTFYYNGKPQ